MNNDPRKPNDDAKLEQELAGLQAEWNGLPQAEPPDLLDQAVLNAARRDLESTSRRRPMRWLGGFATAAVVVVALTLVIEQDPRSTSTAPVPEPAPLQKGAPGASAESAPEASRLQAPLPPAEPETMAREARRDATRLKAAADNAVAEKAEPGAGRRLELSTAAAPAVSDAQEAGALADEALEESALRDPESWIEALLELQASGETDALRAGIAAFRSAYPDYPLPDELAGDEP